MKMKLKIIGIVLFVAFMLSGCFEHIPPVPYQESMFDISDDQKHPIPYINDVTLPENKAVY